MRIVVDTNVYISALVFNKKMQELLETILEDHTVIISPFILQELSRKLFFKFNLEKSVIDTLIQELTMISTLIEPNGTIPVISDDPDDNNILLLAEFSEADLIISGDKDLYALKSYHGIPIIKPSDFQIN